MSEVSLFSQHMLHHAAGITSKFQRPKTTKVHLMLLLQVQHGLRRKIGIFSSKTKIDGQPQLQTLLISMSEIKEYLEHY